MSLIVFEGFDFADRGALTSQSGNLDTVTSTPWSYGRSLRCFVGSGAVSHSFTSTQTIIVGMARFPSSTDPGLCEVCTITDSGTVQIHVVLDTANRRVTVYRGSGTGSQIAQSAVNSLPPIDNWLYLEVKVVIDNSAGSVEVRCDNVSICSASSIDTQASANATGNGWSTDLRVAWLLDDVYICNGAGSVDNNFLGRQRVVEQYPVNEDSPIDFTPSTGTNNALNVDDTSSDSDSTYNSLSSSTGKDKFTVTGGISGGATVNGFALRHTFRKTDYATCTGRAIFATSGADQNGATNNPGIAYATFFDFWEQDPTDSANWTPTKINNMKIGYERVS